MEILSAEVLSWKVTTNVYVCVFDVGRAVMLTYFWFPTLLVVTTVRIYLVTYRISSLQIAVILRLFSRH